MRIVNFFDGFQSETAPTITAIQAEDVEVTPTGSLTADDVQEALEYIHTAHIDLSAAVHGVTGSVVGTTDTQTLSGKTFAQNLLSGSNDTYNVGSNSEKYKHIYLSGNAYVDGTTFSAIVSTASLLSTGKLITVNSSGNDANSEGSGIEVDRTSTNAKIIYGTAYTSKFACGDSGSEIEIATISAAQTLTNKSIDSDNNTITNIVNADIKSSAAIARTKLADGMANYVVINDSGGSQSEEQYLDTTRGGTGITSSATFPSSGVVVTRDATETLTNKTLTSALLNTSLDISAAGAFSLLASIGANNLTIGGATSTIIIPGNVTIQGTTTAINSTNMEVTDKNIVVNKDGNDASSEGAGLTIERTTLDGSIIFGDAYTSKFALGILGAEKEIADISSIQSLSNKTLASPTLSGALSGDAILDEDDFASDSSTKVATQQSIKAYIAENGGDNSFKILGRGTTGDTYISIKGGMIKDGEDILITDDGTDDIYKSGLAADLEYQIAATDLESGAKANSTNYWLYIKKDTLSDVTVEYSSGNDTALVCKSVTASDFTYSTKAPDHADINTDTYVAIGIFRVDASGDLDDTEYTFLDVIPKVTKSSGGGSAIEWESSWIIADTITSFTHGIGEYPKGVAMAYDDAGTIKPLDHFSYVESITSTSITIDWGTLLLDATHKVKIYLSNGTIPSAIQVEQPGVVKMYGADTAPTGYLLCDGSAYSRTTYADLFGVIGTSYGVGDGSTTFNLPNMVEAFPMGKGIAGVGETGGDNDMVDHTHTYSLTAAGQTHSGNSSSVSSEAHTHTVGTQSANHTHTVSSSGTHSHNLELPNVGTTNYTPSINLGGNSTWSTNNSVVRVKSSEGAHTHTTNSISASHNHSVTGGSHTHTVSITHTHSSSSVSGSVGTGSAATSTDNRPNYVSFSYIIKT